MVDFDNLPDKFNTEEIKTPKDIVPVHKSLEEEIIGIVDKKKPAIKPISEAELNRRRLLSERQKGNKNSSKENRLAKAKDKSYSAYAGDITNDVKREKYIRYLEKVRNKELSLDDCEALLHVIISDQHRKPERSRDNKLVVEAIGQIRQITEAKRRIEQAELSITRDQGILNLFEQWARILHANISDPQLLNKLLFEFRSVLNQTIDIKNINRRIDKEVRTLDKDEDTKSE